MLMSSIVLVLASAEEMNVEGFTSWINVLSHRDGQLVGVADPSSCVDDALVPAFV
jgi:hypothetical protein